MKDGIENFPTNYQGYLYAIKERHPNWNFTALYTGLEWNDVINNENVFGTNLVPISYSDRWKNTNPDQYNVEVDANWVDASRQAVLFAMDPRNFLNDVRIFQFENLQYNRNTNNKNAIEKILYGTEFYNNLVNYLDYNKNVIYTNNTYSDLILNAGILSNVNAFHLASRIKQEVGPFLSHRSISGNVEGYEGLYNFYNIGATSSVGQLEAIKKGLQFARDGKGANILTQQRLLIPWNTKERAINGGAIFIGSSYISIGQNTIYFQKFHVTDDIGGKLYTHQYMTNVLAPYGESKSIYQGYYNANLLNESLNFIIPVYNNMPYINTVSPSINSEDYVSENTKVIANVNTSLNIRSGPSSSYEIITRVNRESNIIRIEKCIGSGELWDRIILDNGITGYAYRTYLQEVPKEINSNELIFNNLNISNYEISGLGYSNSVKAVKEKIQTTYRIEFENYKGENLSDNSLVGTGSVLKIYDNNGMFLGSYKFILYGDLNGDGRINSTDLLVLQRHILEIQLLQGVFYKAGNISKNNKNPSSYDSLLIQRHILSLKIIKQ